MNNNLQQEKSKVFEAFQAQAKLYDLFYSLKPYAEEAQKISELIKIYNPPAKSILSIGAGTGRYETEFARIGFSLTGIERSYAMFSIAQQRIEQAGLVKDISLIHADGNSVELDTKYDIVVLLFCVINYCQSVDELLLLFRKCAQYLKKDGLLIFDSWHGPAVEDNPPKYKENFYEYQGHTIKRSVMPFPLKNKNKFRLQYNFSGIPKLLHHESEFSEEQINRAFFPEEINHCLKLVETESLASTQWPDMSPLIESSWNSFWIAKKI